MRVQKYKVKLTEAEARELQEIVNKGGSKEQKVKRAKVLLALDRLNYHPIPNKYCPQKIIANQCGVSTTTVYTISRKFKEEGLEKTLHRRKRDLPARQPIATGDVEARIIALACSEPPPGYSRWTLRLLESKVVELGIVDSISDTTIGRVLKKQNSSLT